MRITIFHKNNTRTEFYNISNLKIWKNHDGLFFTYDAGDDYHERNIPNNLIQKVEIES